MKEVFTDRNIRKFRAKERNFVTKEFQKGTGKKRRRRVVRKHRWSGAGKQRINSRPKFFWLINTIRNELLIIILTRFCN